MECNGRGQHVAWFDYLVHGNGNGVWVGVCTHVSNYSENSSIYVSQNPNGGWQRAFTSLCDGCHYSITFNNGAFVYQLNGVVYTSADGLHWIIPNKHFNPRWPSFSAIGKWILMVTRGPAAHFIYSISKDGNQWQNLSLPIPNPTLKYIDAAALYLAYGLEGQVASSPDGFSWMLDDELSLPDHDSVVSVAYNGKLWVAADDKAGIFIGRP